MPLSSEEEQAFADVISGLRRDAWTRGRTLILSSMLLSAMGCALLVATFSRSLLLGSVGYAIMVGGALLGTRALPALRDRLTSSPPRLSRLHSTPRPHGR